MSEPTIPVKDRVSDGAHIRSMEQYETMYKRSLENPEEFWAEQAETLTWSKKWDEVMKGDFKEVDFQWYLGGRLNACYNCVDRHQDKLADRTAIIWAGDEPGDYRSITYRELKDEVCRMANVLVEHGVKKGDRVCIYLPMIPELAYAMLACARIGAVHSVVFGGFSAESLRDRIVDADCRILVTANEGKRGGKSIPLKKIADEAVSTIPTMKTMLVARRTDTEVPMQAGRDLWLEEEMKKQSTTSPVVDVDAEDPLFILYTSGSTGRPKGVLHTTGGYMVYSALTHRLIFDYRPGDIYFCAADIGWVTGHTYIVYGPLANGATTVMFESIPTYPDAGRYWQVVDDLKVNIFYTAPTALRAIAQSGDQWVTNYKRDSLRVLGSVGEPINPEIWRWYHDVVGNKQCAVVDTWWQTETGGILITPLPGATPTKPGSATFPFFGVKPVIMDENGKEKEGDGIAGPLCIASPWPGQARTIYGDHKRFKDTYFSTYPGYYFTGDGSRRDEDGFYWITGRIDDVINVSGHRLGTAEIESALVAHELVAEAAVVGYPHPIKGTGIYAYVMLTAEHAGQDGGEVEKILKDQVRKVIGPFAAPDVIHVAPGLPKTRSGKIMRRILRKLAEGDYEALGDITTLADSSVVENLVTQHRDRVGSKS